MRAPRLGVIQALIHTIPLQGGDREEDSAAGVEPVDASVEGGPLADRRAAAPILRHGAVEAGQDDVQGELVGFCARNVVGGQRPEDEPVKLRRRTGLGGRGRCSDPRNDGHHGDGGQHGDDWLETLHNSPYALQGKDPVHFALLREDIGHRATLNPQTRSRNPWNP